MSNPPHEGRLETLKRYLVEHGLKSSRQRDLIAGVFFKSSGHLSVDDLLASVRIVEPRVSQATVYRTMKLLTECGLAEARQFKEGYTLFEVSDGYGEHHDHLICTGCNRIVEFCDSKIEDLQDRVAADHGFVVTDHKMELYGLCAACQKTAKS